MVKYGKNRSLIPTTASKPPADVGLDEQTVQKQLDRLNRACLITGRLLYGDLAESPLRAGVRPNLDHAGLKSQLRAMTAALKFDCVELARIFASGVSAPPEPSGSESRVDNAAGWVLRHSSPLGLPAAATAHSILEAAQSGDTDFFIALGKRLEDRSRKNKEQSAEDYKWTLVTLWKPALDWPGLAYCTDAARRDLCVILHGAKQAPSEQVLHRAWRKLGFVSAAKPFITKITSAKGSLAFSSLLAFFGI